MFFVFYGGAGYFSSLRTDVGTWRYDWERYIPFVPIMIIPYMSIDLFFFAAPFLCHTKSELQRLAWRLSAIVMIAAVCFVIFPLQLAVERPHAEGFFGTIYNGFVSMDRPYNLCPSMHIALRTVLAAHYGKHCRSYLRWAMNFWFFLIGCSTLLLYQHHFIDVVGGFVLAVLVMYAIDGLPWRLPKTDGRRLAMLYASISIALVLPVFWLPKLGWITVWPAVSTGLVASGYAFFGPAVYRRRHGMLTWSARTVLAPVLWGQWLSWKYYSHQSNITDSVGGNVLIGRHATNTEAKLLAASGVTAVVGLCNAFSQPDAFAKLNYLSLPVLDLTAPNEEQIAAAIAFIDEHRRDGQVLVHCKAGYSRSACIVAAWMLHCGHATSVDDAIRKLRIARPPIVIRPEIRLALDHWFATNREY
ncbi:hypothetical protein Q31b_14210 [Novipirellula aureliae]|uniref:protein-tyrosine-phosphatase n=1 Tax=Novipirellula aureliae TaxID=2527966 RepID=A0A5C6E9N2_9BACT|nr:hypothetical protein Q31b_14210 [Novipirellula aureliae]